MLCGVTPERLQRMLAGNKFGGRKKICMDNTLLEISLLCRS